MHKEFCLSYEDACKLLYDEKVDNVITTDGRSLDLVVEALDKITGMYHWTYTKEFVVKDKNTGECYICNEDPYFGLTEIQDDIEPFETDVVTFLPATQVEEYHVVWKAC